MDGEKFDPKSLIFGDVGEKKIALAPKRCLVKMSRGQATRSITWALGASSGHFHGTQGTSVNGEFSFQEPPGAPSALQEHAGASRSPSQAAKMQVWILDILYIPKRSILFFRRPDWSPRVGGTHEAQTN